MTRIHKWKSQNCTKGRGQWKPDIIVMHISEGHFESGCEWLCSAKAGASTHFFIARDGRVAQLVGIKDTAWGNGTTSKAGDSRYSGYSNIAAVRQRGGSANNYTISIEHEGIYGQTRGALTEAQTGAAVELIKDIRNEVLSEYGIEIPIDREHIVGHCDIAPRWKPHCPGERYPFDEIIARVRAQSLNSTALSNNGPDTTGLPGLPILAQPSVSVSQMQEWARAKKAAPFFYELAKDFYEISASVGVDPAVSYAQSALETGCGRFGGVIDESYHNPCGLKTTMGGGNYEPGAHMRFPTWQEGIQAQVDHLALYAGAPGYPKAETPDPRHFASICGKAPTVEGLTGKWATDPQYAPKLIKAIEGIRATQVAAPHVEPPRPNVSSDTPSSWAQEAWTWTKTFGLVDGTRPLDTVTREELAVIIFRYWTSTRAGALRE